MLKSIFVIIISTFIGSAAQAQQGKCIIEEVRMVLKDSTPDKVKKPVASEGVFSSVSAESCMGLGEIKLANNFIKGLIIENGLAKNDIESIKLTSVFEDEDAKVRFTLNIDFLEIHREF